MHAGQGPNLVGFDDLPQQVDGRGVTSSFVYALFGVSCWSKEFPLKEQTLCVM